MYHKIIYLFMLYKHEIKFCLFLIIFALICNLRYVNYLLFLSIYSSDENWSWMTIKSFHEKKSPVKMFNISIDFEHFYIAVQFSF